MKRDSNSNQRLNEHKVETNSLIRPIDDLIKQLGRINPKYFKVDNIVETYRDKVYSIYNDLEKNNIDFWNNDFLLSDAILKYLDSRVIEGTQLLIDLSSEIANKSNKLIFIVSSSQKQSIEKYKKLNNEINEYNIKESLYKTLIEYYQNMRVTNLKPKDIVISYIIIKGCIKDLKIEKTIDKNKEKEIINEIAKKEKECLDYRKKLEEVLKIIESINDEEKIKKILNKNKGQ